MDTTTIMIIIAIIVIAAVLIYLVKPKQSVSVDVLYSDALNAILKGDNKEAVKLLKQVVNNDSDNIGAYLQLGNLLRSINPQQSAKIHQSLTVRPKLSKTISKEIHQALASDYVELSDYKRAKIEAEMVLKYDKNSIWVYQLLLQIAEKQSDWDNAATLATKLQKLTGKQDSRQLAEIQLQAGIDKLEGGENKKALRHFQSANKYDAKYCEPYMQIGNIYESDGNLKKSIPNWEKYLINSERDDAQIYKKVESALFELGRFGDVEQIYSRILEKNPINKNALVKLSKLLNDKDEKDKALDLIDKAIKQDQDLISARLMKIKILLGQANEVDLHNQIDDIIEKIEK